MKVSIEEKKAEAFVRMKKLDIFPETIRQFKDDGKISISEPPMGAFYWLEGEELEHAREFEADYNALVYLAIRSYTSFGRMDCFLYVSDNADEWESDRADIDDPSNGIYAYVYNHDMPDCSEIGCIGVEHTPAAGLVRIW